MVRLDVRKADHSILMLTLKLHRALALKTIYERTLLLRAKQVLVRIDRRTMSVHLAMP